MTSPPTTGHKIFGGRYAVEAPLGSGATATVYLCHDRTTMQSVAVKVLHTDLAESVGAERFLREIRLTAGLDHPSILPVIDSGADGSILWCVLPYMEGGTLRDLLREKKQLAIPEAIEIGKTIADALAYAHDRGLIHRDIKPENILFSKGKAFLGDFGIARALYATASDLTTTSTGVIRGTPAYMSPEQASGERNYDGRSDIYSLGAVVYEMISGMPPFVGPTAQSVMAQRFSHTPREMRVYRGSVSPTLEQVVAKAMTTAPADRYPSAREFVDALAGAAATDERPGTLRSRRALFVGAMLAIAAAGAMLIPRRWGGAPAADVGADTTQLVVIPFEKTGDTRDLGSIEPLIYSAFSRWRGLSVLEPYRVRDAILRAGAAGRRLDPREVALSLGAGRYVRGEIGQRPSGQGWVINASLYQVDRDTALEKASVVIAPSDLVRLDHRYLFLARSLLLRGKGSDSVAMESTLSNDLPAMQEFARGVDALGEWDFPAADTAFQRALDRDPGFASAALSQAHVRLWQRLDSRNWAPLAERAIKDSIRLPRRERDLALALHALGTGQYQAACSIYQRLTQANSTDFAAWFGLGRCQEADPRVLRDATSPTGWRYRSSFHSAMTAYERAFAVLSLSHRSLQRAAFQPLRDLLVLSPSEFRRATPEPPDTTKLFGRLDMAGDTLVMRPLPAALIASGDPAAVPTGIGDAIRLQQQRFRAIARRWSTSLPRSPGAKEAVAVALEMSGDPSAIDTLRLAAKLANDDATRIRLNTAQLLLRVKLLRANDRHEAAAIRHSVDSVLAANNEVNQGNGPQVAVLGALVGDCKLLRRTELTRFGAATPNPGLVATLVGEADALTARLALGCPVGDVELNSLRERIAAASGFKQDWMPSLLGTSARLALEAGLNPPGDLLSPGDYIVRAWTAARRANRDTVRAILKRIESSRSTIGVENVKPEAVLLEAHLRLRVGDSAAAESALDRYLDKLPALTPGILNAPVCAASLVSVMQLRGDLAAARGGTAAKGWSAVAIELRQSR